MSVFREKKLTAFYLVLSLVIILIAYQKRVMSTTAGTLLLLVGVVVVLPLALSWAALMIEQIRSRSFIQKMNRMILDYREAEQPPEALYQRFKELEPEIRTETGKAVWNLNVAQVLMFLGRTEEADRHIRVCENCHYPNPAYQAEVARSRRDLQEMRKKKQ